jgi:parallel beta-helix repeat protein
MRTIWLALIATLAMGGNALADCTKTGTQWNNGGLISQGGNCAPHPVLSTVTVGGATITGVGATSGKVAAGNDARFGLPSQSLAFVSGGTTSWNTALGTSALLSMAGPTTLGCPVNLTSGLSYSLRVTQDATGSRAITWPSCITWPGTPGVLSTAANAVDVLSLFSFDGSTLNAVAFNKGYGAVSGTLPGLVTALAAQPLTASTIPLAWTAPTTGTTPILYEVDYTPHGGSSWATSSTGISGTSYTVSGLLDNTAYDTRVIPSNTVGSGSATVLSNTVIPQVPGISTALYSKPYYNCNINYYVAASGGSDSNPGTSGSPWATLAHADLNQGPGVCVNLLPGTYATGVVLTHGGNAANASGYAVWRCTTLLGCIGTDVHAGSQNGFWVWNTYNCFASSNCPSTNANYLIFDGFNMLASSQTSNGQAYELWDGNDTVANSSFSNHHIWVINNDISNWGQAGIQANDGEYFYFLHNNIHGNSMAGCGAQGSGISVLGYKVLAGYTPTADDTNNPMLGAIGSNSHNAIEWNTVYNNSIGGAPCWSVYNATPNTDGNGIIIDTMDGRQGSGQIGGPVYLGGIMVSFNKVYNNGGNGIHPFFSGNLTIANNTCYNNGLDLYNHGTDRSCIDGNQVFNIKYANNIAQGITFGAQNFNYPTQFTASISGGTNLNVTAIVGGTGSLSPLQIVYMSGTSSMTGLVTIVSQQSGTTGGTGVYTISATQPNIASSASFQAANYGQFNSAMGSAYDATEGGQSPGTPPAKDTFNNNVVLCTGSVTPTYGCYGVNNGDTFSTSANFIGDPLWVAMGNISTGTISTPPNGTDTALQSSSPALNYGVTDASYSSTPAQASTAGACSGSLAHC